MTEGSAAVAAGAVDISARAEAVLSRCRQLGVRPAQLRRLPGYGRLLSARADEGGCSGQQGRRWVLPALLVLLAAVLMQQQLYTVAGLSRLLFRIEGISERAEQVSTRRDDHPAVHDRRDAESYTFESAPAPTSGKHLGSGSGSE